MATRTAAARRARFSASSAKTTAKKFVRDPNPVPSLRYFSTRKVAILWFQSHIRWRRLPDATRSLKETLAEFTCTPQCRKDLHDAIGLVIREVQRWGAKHVEMFEGLPVPAMKERAHRSEHLRTFYYCLQWVPSKYEINDYQTCTTIMERECAQWPQMKFQFACAYAMRSLIEDDFEFDKYRLSTFRKRLADHPVYDFWLTLLSLGGRWDRMFNMEGRTPNQRLMLCFRFSMTHGYTELMRFLWSRVEPQHREYIGLLQWRALCYQPRSRDSMKFLCEELCKVNPVSIARLTWTIFFDALYKTINNEEASTVVDKENMAKLQFILEHCCQSLRERLLSMENYRAVTDAFRYNQGEMFAMFLDNLTDEQLPAARERIDRIYGRQKSKDGATMRRMMLRRQQTIDGSAVERTPTRSRGGGGPLLNVFAVDPI